MAEAVFRSITSSDARVSLVDSAGTAGYHDGSAPDPRTMSTLEGHGIHDYIHAARQVSLADFTRFNYILAMDADNLRNLQRLRQRAVAGKDDADLGQVVLFGDFGGRTGEEVEDPYYGATNGFEQAYDQMVRFSQGFLVEIFGRVDTSAVDATVSAQ